MDNKLINREIRKISNYSSLPIAIFILFMGIFNLVYSPVMEWILSLGIYVPEDIQYFIIYTIQYVGVAFLAIGIFFFTRKKSTGLSFKNCFRKPEMSAGWIAKWTVIAIAFGYIANYFTVFISFLLDKFFGITTTPLDLDFGDSGFATFTLVLALSIYAPFFEELLFRGAVYRNSELMGQKFAMIVTGITFGLWHMNFVQLTYASVLGIFASFLYAKTRSIIPSMILHSIVNTISAVISICYSFMGDPASYENEMELVMENPVSSIFISYIAMAIFGIIIAGIVLFIIELVKHRHQLKLQKSVFPVSAIRKFVVYFTAPVTLITFAFLIVMTIMSLF